MKLLCISDIHGEKKRYEEVLNRHPDVEYVLHLGDIGFSIKPQKHFYFVCGNHDTKLPMQKKLCLENMQILLLHSHIFDEILLHDLYHGASFATLLEKRYALLFALAKQEQADIVVFGHTHIPCVQKQDAITLLNPGSLFCNYDHTGPSYALLEIQDKTCKIQHYAWDEQEKTFLPLMLKKETK